jgi:hypothetical protein
MNNTIVQEIEHATNVSANTNNPASTPRIGGKAPKPPKTKPAAAAPVGNQCQAGWFSTPSPTSCACPGSKTIVQSRSTTLNVGKYKCI